MGRSRRVGVIVVALLTVVAVLPGAGFGLVGADDDPAQTDGEGGNATGVQLAAFAGTTASEANASVEEGMWEATVDRSENKSRAVVARTGTLEQRLERLRNASEQLRAAHENDTLPEPAYNARAASIQSRISSLSEAVNRTGDVASEAGVNVTRLDRLRTAASNLTGPEVAAIARNLTAGGPPAGVPGRPGGNGSATPGGGPPTDGPPGQGPPDGTEGPPGAGDGGSGNGQAPGSGGSGGDGNQPTDTGPPSDAGPPTDAGPPSDAGPPTDAGPPS